jgi:glycosyltransferase involved in cell wall biosynthesis
VITVVIPTHNRQGNLRRAIKSVFGQTVSPKELIVIDDASDDPVTNAVFDDAPDGLQCILLRNEVSKGGNYSRNLGINYAGQNFISFLDDDDYFCKDKVERCLDAIAQHPTVDVIYHSAMVHVDECGVKYKTFPKDLSNEPDIFKSLLLKNCIGGTSMVTIRRRTLLDVGNFDEEQPALQDYELWLRLAKHGKRFLFIDCPLTEYECGFLKSSISRDLKKHWKAMDRIDNIYRSEISTLPLRDQKERRVQRLRVAVYKSMINGRYFDSLGYQLKIIGVNYKFKDLLTFFVMIMGRCTVFRIRQYLS